MALGCAFQGKYEAGDKEGPASEQIHSLFEVLHATAYRKVAHSELDSLREHGARCKHKQQMSARMEGSEPRSPAVPQPPNPLPCPPSPPSCGSAPSLPGHRCSPTGSFGASSAHQAPASCSLSLSQFPSPRTPAVCTRSAHLPPLLVARGGSHRDSYADISFSKKVLKEQHSPRQPWAGSCSSASKDQLQNQTQRPNGFVLHYLIVTQLISNA